MGYNGYKTEKSVEEQLIKIDNFEKSTQSFAFNRFQILVIP
jgi:hypothetical protein